MTESATFFPHSWKNPLDIFKQKLTKPWTYEPKNLHSIILSGQSSHCFKIRKKYCTVSVNSKNIKCAGDYTVIVT